MHPWYRVSHIYSTINKDENIDYILKVQNRCAQAARLEMEGAEILDKMRKNIKQIETLADDLQGIIKMIINYICHCH